MAFMSTKRKKIKDHELKGFKYFKAISTMLESLHDAGCERDIAGNRILHMDQYASLLLLYMFNPICNSLRSLQQVSELKKVQKQFGAARASLGSLSEASTVFDSPCNRTKRVVYRYSDCIMFSFYSFYFTINLRRTKNFKGWLHLSCVDTGIPDYI
jgi:hypothetical protein